MKATSPEAGVGVQGENVLESLSSGSISLKFISFLKFREKCLFMNLSSALLDLLEIFPKLTEMRRKSSSPGCRSRTYRCWILIRARSFQHLAMPQVRAAAVADLSGIRSGIDWNCSDSLDRIANDPSDQQLHYWCRSNYYCCCYYCYYYCEIHQRPAVDSFDDDNQRSSRPSSAESCCRMGWDRVVAKSRCSFSTNLAQNKKSLNLSNSLLISAMIRYFLKFKVYIKHTKRKTLSTIHFLFSHQFSSMLNVWSTSLCFRLIVLLFLQDCRLSVMSGGWRKMIVLREWIVQAECRKVLSSKFSREQRRFSQERFSSQELRVSWTTMRYQLATIVLS